MVVELVEEVVMFSTLSTLWVFRCCPAAFSGWKVSRLSRAWLGLSWGGERLSAGGGGAFLP